MKRLGIGAISIIVGIVFSSAAVGQATSPIERYGSESEAAVMTCSLEFQLAQAQAQLVSVGGGQPEKPADFAACLKKARAEGKQLFSLALAKVKKPAAKEALKSYHVAFMTALEGISPGMDERRITYEARQRSLKDKMTEAWARFEVEQ